MTTGKSKPRLFVGSSIESIDVAYAIQENLEYDAEVTVWSQGVFDLSKTALESLLRALGGFDFAVFVFAPDDIVRIKRQRYNAVRDNVIYELGLFMGRLGKDRAFIITPRGESDLRLPTDLLGVTPGLYEPKRKDRNLAAALGPACTKLKRSLSHFQQPKKKRASRAQLSSPVAAGLSTELREEISGFFTEQAEKVEQVFQTFEKRLGSYAESKSETTLNSDDQIAETIRVVQDELSDDARGLLKAITPSHITYEEYQSLKASPISDALVQLRDVGFLVPLSGWAPGRRKIVVYWFRPDLSETLRMIAEGLPNPHPHVAKRIQLALENAKYREFRLRSV